MVPQGLPLLATALPTQLLRVEQGLSVLGDVVLLVRVEQGLTPWPATVHCHAKKKELLLHRRQHATVLKIRNTKAKQNENKAKSPFFKQKLQEAEALS